MKRLSLVLGAMALALTAASPAQADYSIVRWTYGDCKIWADPPGTGTVPIGSGWAIVAANLPYFEAAKAVLEDLYRQGVCR
jgi:hypothetical protein